MEFKDTANQNFQFHYNREERLKGKRKREETLTRKGIRLFGFNLGSPLSQTLLNFIFIMLIVTFIRIWLIPTILKQDEKYQIKTKEMLFKDEILIEVSLKSLSKEISSYLVWAKNSSGKSDPWQGKLIEKGEKILYFSLPVSHEESYILWVKENNCEPMAIKRDLP